MLRRQCGNQLRAERDHEMTKLIAIIDDDEAMLDAVRDLMEAAGFAARVLRIRGGVPQIRFAW